jgi:ATP-dependent DNA helicase RecQ
MIYTIGYQKRTPSALIAILKVHGVTFLVDVRSKPYGRKTEFNKSRLDPAMAAAGINYVSRPDLGGFGIITDKSIDSLAALQESETVCIMCMEHDPSQCHRGYEIAPRLAVRGIGAMHL